MRIPINSTRLLMTAASVILLLEACAPPAPIDTSSLEPAITATSTPDFLGQTPVGVPPATAAGPTPPTRQPISSSDIAHLSLLAQWDLGSEIVRVTGISLSPQADRLALLTLRYPELYSLEVRDSQTGSLIWKHDLTAKAAYPALTFSTDGRQIAAGLGNGQVLIWNVPDGSLSQTLAGPSYAVRAVTFSPDGSLIAASGSDSRVHVWQISDGAVRTVYSSSGNVGSLVFSPDGRYLAAVSDVFAVYDLSAGKAAPLIYASPLAPHTTQEILFSPDGRSLIAQGELNDVNHNTWIPRILVWNLGSNRQASLKIPLPAAIQNMAVLPGGQTLLGYESGSGQLEAIDIQGKSIVGTVKLGALQWMDYSADLSRIATVAGPRVALWGILPQPG